MEKKLWIDVEGAGRVSGSLSLPDGKRESMPWATGIILAHGAGGHMDNPDLVQFARDLSEAGHPVLRFNFFYTESGRKAPDRPPLLGAAWEAAHRAFAAREDCRLDSIVAAGKSMGGRIASELVAAGRLSVKALVFLGYPLHPAGRPERLRDAHLYHIRVPLLFFAGTRDPLCNLDLLRGVLGRLEAPFTLDVVEGGDHSFHLPRSAGTPSAEVYRRLAERTGSWLAGLGG
ncbi:MAG: alpha/beta fold hydrolase [Deltaproteobacteria bacterium]|nr:alpha/beta fold hydrolase [Deltaproteobacteria bacterium]